MFGAKVTRMFFDKALVEGKIDRATYVVMSRFGAFVRQSGRRNFRRGTAKIPVPPKPRNIKGFLRDGRYGIQFEWDPIRRTTVVGPQIFPSTKDKTDPPPKRVERGGVFTVTRKSKSKTAVVNRTHQAKYREFPFMRNALAKELPNLPGLFRNTIR